MLSKRHFRISERIRRRMRMRTLSAAVIIVSLAGCGSFDYLTQVTEQFPRAKQCGKCHVEVYHEWAVSDHASAYTNPHYRRATDDYTFNRCLSCHVPEPTLSDRPPIARSMHPDEGITCVSCHLEQGKLTGPIEPTGKVAPHPVGVRPEFYKNSIACGQCHEGTYAEWTSAANADKKSCQQCHMSSVKRKVTQPTGGFSNVIVSFEKEVSLRRHDFAILTSASTERPVSFDVQRSGSQVVLILKNNLPHTLPTGDFGYRVMLLKIFAVDRDDSVVSLGEEEFAKELGNAIPAEGTARWLLDVPSETKAIRVRLIRQSYEEENILGLMDVEMPLP